MQQHLSVVTLGVKDIPRARKFYESLGWQASPKSKHNLVYFQLVGLFLALYSEPDLAREAGLSDVDTHSREPSFRGVVLSHNVAQKSDVEKTLQDAQNAGGKLQKAAQETSWGGFAGFFTDPDGHLWEVVWNPRNFFA